MSPADTLERDLARTLTAKADQVDVAEPPPMFADGDRHSAVVIHLSPRRSGLRRAVLAAAGVAAVVAVVVAGTTARRDEPEVAVERPDRRTSGAAGVGADPLVFLPSSVPEGWSLVAVDAAPGRFEIGPQQWQLFGAPDRVPGSPGVLVGTAPRGDRVIVEPNDRIHGAPAEVGDPDDPSHPAGSVTAQWIEGDVVHDVVAVGMSGHDVVEFLDALVARDDPGAGFDAPADTALRESGAATVLAAAGASVTYAAPHDPDHTVQITTASTDVHGGLLHRLDGTAGPDGWSLVRRVTSDDGGPRLVSAVRPDGWTVDLAGWNGVDDATLDAFLASLELASGDDLIDLASAQPVTARYAFADRTVEVHGTEREPVGMCVTGAGGAEPSCSTAEALPVEGRLAASSLVVDGRWVVVTISGDDALDVHTAPADPAGWADHDSRELSPAAMVHRGGVDVAVYEVPGGTKAVEAVAMADGTTVGAGFVYEDPVA
ncbi:MAG TPA: hypothetical protein VJM49_08925 [Acidimicrobiales bacterium]|nr:hypothetical protein [Acidimicrobiales bacterium]